MQDETCLLYTSSSDDFHGKYLLSVCLMELLSSGRKILLLEVYTMGREDVYKRQIFIW